MIGRSNYLLPEVCLWLKIIHVHSEVMTTELLQQLVLDCGTHFLSSCAIRTSRDCGLFRRRCCVTSDRWCLTKHLLTYIAISSADFALHRTEHVHNDPQAPSSDHSGSFVVGRDKRREL